MFTKVRRGSQVSWDGSYRCQKTWYGCWELNLGPPQQQSALLRLFRPLLACLFLVFTLKLSLYCLSHFLLPWQNSKTQATYKKKSKHLIWRLRSRGESIAIAVGATVIQTTMVFIINTKSTNFEIVLVDKTKDHQNIWMDHVYVLSNLQHDILQNISLCIFL